MSSGVDRPTREYHCRFPSPFISRPTSGSHLHEEHMTDTAKPADWTQARRDGHPEGGLLRAASRADTARSFPKTPACYGFTIIAKIKPGRESRHPRLRQDDRDRRSAALPDCPRRAQAPLPALGALRHRRRHVLHVPGHLRHRLRQVHRGRGRRCSPSSASTRSSRISKAFPRTGRRTRRRSSSSFAITSARASSSTANIRT